MTNTKLFIHSTSFANCNKTEISYSNDVFFKFALIGDDKVSQWLRRFIVKSVFNLYTSNLTIINSEIIPKSIIGKKVILDVLCKDEHEHYINYEMQVSGYTISEQLRFQEYGYRLVGRQLKKGNNYLYLKPFFQIIFIKAMPLYGNNLVQHFKVKDDSNLEEPNGTLNRAIVFLKCINFIVKKKGGFNHLNEFEKLCYILENNEDDVILKTESKAVKFIMEKHEEMKNNESWWNWADAVERGERAAKGIMREKMQKGMQRGMQKGKQLGIQQGKKDILNEFLLQKYGIESTSWLQSLNKVQLDHVMKVSVNCDTFQKLKSIIASYQRKT